MKKTTKQGLMFFLCLWNIIAHGQNTHNTVAHSFLQKDSITSTLDGNTQVIYYFKALHSKPRPLVVQLHSWSYSADDLQNINLDSAAKSKNWNYIFPNFRGVNNHPKACCSEFVLSDIDEAIDWALTHMNIDKKRIYVVGHSGGGYATLAMYMKSRHRIQAFSAWVPISNLVDWYGESVERKNKYAAEIIKCIGANDTFDEQKAKERSPIYWKTPLKKRKKSYLQIYTGIHDGYTGSVPISQSINFYNKLLADAKEPDKSKFVSPEDLSIMLKTRTSPSSKTFKLLGKRDILYQKSSKNIQLTVFEGTHEMLSKVVLENLE
ncbi:MAG: alpha/beta fold hydrolase [Leadbetterella sp.]|nr:alpha/beta fold hydrolase [Leadbetterella sp.]